MQRRQPPNRSRVNQLAAMAAGIVLALAMPGESIADDTQRIEERLPTGTSPADGPAQNAAAVSPDSNEEFDLASIPEFALRSVTVDGLKAINRDQAEACAKNTIGTLAGAADLVAITQCITKLYRDEGYFLSRAIIPRQEVNAGALRIKAIEGFVVAITPTGIDQAGAEMQFSATLQEHPVKLSTFERDLLLLSDRHGLRVESSQLVADPKDPSRYTLKLAVSLNPVTWRIFADNRGTEANGPDQVFASVAWNSIFGESDRLTTSLFTTPSGPHELLYADLNYAHGWAGNSFWTEAGASLSRSDDGSVPASQFNIASTDRIYGRLSAPLLRSRAQSLWAALAFDFRDTEALASSGAHTQESARVLRGSLSYTLVSGAMRTDINLEASQGIDAMSASSNGDMNLSRVDGRPQFTKLRLDATSSLTFSDRWGLVLTTAAQLADGALIAGEEFSVGGARFGRGFDYSEITGDHGLAGALELRWTKNALTGLIRSLQLYGFVDAGGTWNRTVGASLATWSSLSSGGAGLRISFAPGFLLNVELAAPLSCERTSDCKKDPRLFLSLAAGW